VAGGQLLSFVPAGGSDVLWLSPLSRQPPTPIRGGIPVCWPYFATMGQSKGMPSHGLVRTLPWQLRDASRAADGSLTLVLTPPPLDGLPLRLTMTLHIGRTLTQTLATENIGRQPVTFTEALHNYFRVGDVRAVHVAGLAGLDYLDKKDHRRVHRQHGDWTLAPQGRSDRIYTAAGGRYVLHDPVLGRDIRIRSRGSRSAVVWNAGGQAARDIADIGAGWRHYLSVEVANVVPDAIELQPGGRHELEQVIEVTRAGARHR
jgi:glucose-6-phosphate 1-epimerase